MPSDVKSATRCVRADCSSLLELGSRRGGGAPPLPPTPYRFGDGARDRVLCVLQGLAHSLGRIMRGYIDGLRADERHWTPTQMEVGLTHPR